MFAFSPIFDYIKDHLLGFYYVQTAKFTLAGENICGPTSLSIATLVKICYEYS